MAIPLCPVDMRRLLRRRHAARYALQVTLHAGRRALKLLQVFVSQTIEPERAGLITEFLGHRISPLLERGCQALGNDRPDCPQWACKSSAPRLSAGRHFDQFPPDDAQSADA